MLVKDQLLIVWAYLAFTAFVMGFVYGPLASFLPSLFPVAVRYSGVSFSFNLAAILGGALTPIIAGELAKAGGLPYVGAYLAGAGVVSLLGLLLLAKRRA
jgi:MFS family permease